MTFLFLESFYEGSHARFADGLVAASAHDIDLYTMPGDYWKWRMLGAALYFAETAPDPADYAGLVVTDLFNLADFLAITGLTHGRRPPVLLYFHENQITYPPPVGDKGAFQMGMINITSALAADRLVFNSAFHLKAFLQAVPAFLQKGRDCPPRTVLDRLRKKASVLYPGVSVPAPPPAPDSDPAGQPPLIIWNHRWSFDKNYVAFFEALQVLDNRQIDFRLALLGENNGRTPPEFIQAQERFGHRLCRFGYVTSRAEYFQWLYQGDIIVSTALQENYGLAVIEAILCGCHPLLPHRLAYPEILPTTCHQDCLYHSQSDLIDKLEALLQKDRPRPEMTAQGRRALEQFLWSQQIGHYDRVLAELARIRPGLP